MKKDRFREMCADLFEFKFDIKYKKWESTEEFLKYFLNKYNLSFINDIKNER